MDFNFITMGNTAAGSYLQKTSDFSPVSAVMPSWVTGRTIDREEAFVIKPDISMCELPVEFWNHELIESDFRNEEALFAFVEKWGAPYHPLRNSPFLTEERKDKVGISQTEKHLNAFRLMPKVGQVDESGVFYPEEGSPILVYISKEEAIHSLQYLQLLISKFVYGVGGFSDREALEVINRASCNSRLLRSPGFEASVLLDATGISLASRGLLTSAICNQLIDSFMDAAEWRVCACDGCGRVFKRKRPDKPGVMPDCDSKYCCTKHKNRQAKKNQRAAAKVRIQH